MKSTLKITAKGQITLRKELLEHLGIAPGERVEVEAGPGPRLHLRPERKGRIEAVYGLLTLPGEGPVSVEEIGRAAAEGWTGR